MSTKREQLARAAYGHVGYEEQWDSATDTEREHVFDMIDAILAELRTYPPDGVWEVFQKHAKHSANDYAFWQGDAGNFAATWQAMIDAIE